MSSKEILIYNIDKNEGYIVSLCERLRLLVLKWILERQSGCVDKGPEAIREMGLVQEITNLGYDVIDHGDVIPMEAISIGSTKM